MTPVSASLEQLPTVGVIIPNHSRVFELSQAIASVTQQGYRGPVTVYLVYQPRPEIEPLLEGLDDRVRAIPFEHETDVAGIAARRNVGLDASDEDLVALLDDDDIWHPEKLSRQVEALLRDPDAVGVATGFVKFRSPGSPEWPATDRTKVEKMSRYEIARSGAIATTSMAFRGALARRLRFDERPEWLGVDDYHFRLRVAEIGPIVRLSDVLTGMRTDESSASRRRQALQYARALDVLAEWMKQGNRNAALRGAFLAKCLFTSLVPASNGDPEAASVVRSALDGRVFGRIDRLIAGAIERGWHSRRVVPFLRGLLWSKPVQRLRGIRVADDAGGK